MNIKTKKNIFLFLTFCSLPLLTLTLITSLLLTNIINPMAIAFITPVTIENRLTEKIYITPIGAYGPESEQNRNVLPQVLFRYLYIPSMKTGNFVIHPGKKRTVYYDWDDINFSEIYIRTHSWEKVYIANPEPFKRQYRTPISDYIVIDNMSTLIEPSENIIKSLSGVQRINIIYFTALLGALAPFGVGYLYFQYRKCKKLISKNNAVSQ